MTIGDTSLREILMVIHPTYETIKTSFLFVKKKSEVAPQNFLTNCEHVHFVMMALYLRPERGLPLQIFF